MRFLLTWTIAALVGCSAGTWTSTSVPAGPAPAVVAGARAADRPRAEPLRFTVADGAIVNHFYRDDGVSAHLLLRSGERPRTIAAFPADNTGIGLWMSAPDGARLEAAGELTAVRRDLLRGVAAVIEVDRPALVTGLALGSIRHLRDLNAGHPPPAELAAEVEHDGARLSARRTSLSGEHRYALELLAEDETTLEETGSGVVRIVPPAGKAGRVRMTFLHDQPALTPIPLDRLLSDAAAPDERERQVLAFLAYEEKLLAGSWRFLTYFGRDTLFSTCLLMPVLEPVAIEGALGSVIERLSPGGEVAHEEDIGDFAAWRHKQAGEPVTEAPIYDYKMIDDDFLLAPVLLAWLETPAGAERAAAFWARSTPAGLSYAAAVSRNLDFVLAEARPFADEPAAGNLIALRGTVGDWRDSEDGLGGGRYSYSVNAALVPAALRAAAALYAAPPFEDPRRAAEAVRLAAAWQNAPALFEVTVPAARAELAVRRYAAAHGFDPGAAAEVDAPFSFWALSLDERGRPVPIAHTDVGFAMLFGAPTAVELERMARLIEAPFPLGLRTPVGVVVANAAFVPDAALRRKFGPDSYHGAVVWSWQQAVLAAGLARQLARGDLPAPTRAQLARTEKALWQVIGATADRRAGEYWSWQAENGELVMFRPGQGRDHESNAAQLWSTVYLAVRPPR